MQVLQCFYGEVISLQGVLKVNQFIEVRPGIVVKDETGSIKCTPIYSRIVSLYAEQNELQFAVPGGLIGVGTTMDPTLTRADRLVGQVLGEVGSLPEVFVELEVRSSVLNMFRISLRVVFLVALWLYCFHIYCLSLIAISLESSWFLFIISKVLLVFYYSCWYYYNVTIPKSIPVSFKSQDNTCLSEKIISEMQALLTENVILKLIVNGFLILFGW